MQAFIGRQEAKPSGALGQSVAFVTSAWQRDWKVVLDPKRYAMIVDSQRYEFPVRLVVLNNFKDAASTAAAARAAERLVRMGLATDIVFAQKTLTDEVLRVFDFEPDVFWKLNPWFSSAHLAALYFLRGKADWMLYFNGDVRLERACNWIPRALAALKGTNGFRGFNVCRNIYQDWYPGRCDEETDDFWISFPIHPNEVQAPGHGFSLSDHSYFIPVNPAEGWKFGIEGDLMRGFYLGFPPYARPCFELYYRVAMYRFGFGHAALKPRDGFPIAKHKNFPNSWKLSFYKAIGYYQRNRRYGTVFE